MDLKAGQRVQFRMDRSFVGVILFVAQEQGEDMLFIAMERGGTWWAQPRIVLPV